MTAALVSYSSNAALRKVEIITDYVSTSALVGVATAIAAYCHIGTFGLTWIQSSFTLLIVHVLLLPKALRWAARS